MFKILMYLQADHGWWQTSSSPFKTISPHFLFAIFAVEVDFLVCIVFGRLSSWLLLFDEDLRDLIIAKFRRQYRVCLGISLPSMVSNKNIIKLFLYSKYAIYIHTNMMSPSKNMFFIINIMLGWTTSKVENLKMRQFGQRFAQFNWTFECVIRRQKFGERVELRQTAQCR